MNLIWLEDFLALARTGHFSRAAQDRHSSQPAFSRRIRALEDWLGVALFDRASHPVQLTEAGRWLVDVAQDMLARAARLPIDARQIARADAHTLRLAATHALSSTFVPAWLQDRGHADLGEAPVQLMSDVLTGCETMMREARVQFVICHAHPQSRTVLDDGLFESVQVGSDTLLPVSQACADATPRHALSCSNPGTMVPLLAYASGSGLGRIVDSVQGHRLATLPHRIIFTAHLASVLTSMVLDGRGIAWLPQSLVQNDLDQNRLARAGGAEWDIALAIRLYRDPRSKDSAAQTFWRRISPLDPLAPGRVATE